MLTFSIADEIEWDEAIDAQVKKLLTNPVVHPG
jgi:phosphoribosylformylglycinamidine (FGAM) synthase PurS component